MRRIGVSLIGLATVIVLLHSITPHKHQSSLSNINSITQLNEENNLIQFLQFIFHPDLGENHLEDFQNEHQLKLDLSSLAFIAVAFLIVPQIEEDVIHSTPYLLREKEKIFLFQNNLRGPPALV